MLGKLLKYEIKAMGRVMLPLYAVMVFAACLFAFNLRLNMSGVAKFIVDRFAIVTGFLFGAAVLAVFVVMVIIVIQRFYKNLLGTEGYLMFTLPARTHEHILSKAISSFLWILIGGAAGLAALTIIVIALFMQLSGLKRAAKDENAFRTAWFFAIGMLAVDVLGGLITARGGSSLVSDTSHIFSVFVFIFTVTGISNLANRMNRPDMGALGLKVLVLQVAMSLVSFILSLFTGSSGYDRVYRLSGLSVQGQKDACIVKESGYGCSFNSEKD